MCPLLLSLCLGLEIIGRFWHLKCEAPHFLRLQVLMTRHWFYNIDQWLAHTVFSGERSIFRFQFLGTIILTGKTRHHLENRPLPSKMLSLVANIMTFLSWNCFWVWVWSAGSDQNQKLKEIIVLISWHFVLANLRPLLIMGLFFFTSDCHNSHVSPLSFAWLECSTLLH